MPKIQTYLSCIKRKKFPYFEIVNHLIEKMEEIYNRMKALSANSEEVKVYFAINPTIIQQELEKKINKKVSTHLICWVIKAHFLGCKFKKYRVSYGKGGVKRFYLEINEANLSLFKNFIENIEASP